MKSLKNKNTIRILSAMSILFVLTLAGCTGTKNKTTSTPTNNESSKQQEEPQKNNSEETNKKTQEENSQTKNTNAQNANVPKFSKKQLDKNVKVQFNTSWKSSENKTYSACIQGKGEDAAEEGVGKILVKNASGNISSFEISGNNKISPRNIEWADDENLLVVIGSSQGTISKGGNLYMINVNTGETSLVMQTPDKKQQIMSSQKSGNNVNLKVTVYEDDNYNASHIENWIIYSFDSSLNKSMEVKTSEGKDITTIGGGK